MSLIVHMEVNTCLYIKEYFNYEKNNYDLFRCSEERINDEYCIFHSSIPSLNNDYIIKVIKRITEKINEGIQKNQSILFIGYNIPELIYRVSFTNEMYLPHLDETQHSHPDLPVPIYFSYSNFYGRIVITNYHFKSAYFDNCQFNSNVTISASFLEKASFKMCIFNESANFSLLRTLDIDLTDCKFDNSFLEVKKSKNTFNRFGYCLLDSGAFNAYMNTSKELSGSNRILWIICVMY